MNKLKGKFGSRREQGDIIEGPEFDEADLGDFTREDTFMTYLAITHTTLPQYSKTDFQVRRRFKDFDALSRLLAFSFRGYFIPPRPRKQLPTRSEKQIENRRKALERYLNRLAQHPQISRSEELRVFLELEGDLRSSPMWQELQPKQPTLKGGTEKLFRQIAGKDRVISANEASMPTRASRDVFRAVKEQTMGRGLVKPGMQLPSNESKLREERQVFEEMGKQIGRVHAGSQKVEGRFMSWGKELSEMGLRLRKLGDFEGDNRVTEDEQVVFKVAEALVDVGNFTQTQAKQLLPIVETLDYYKQHTPAIRRAMNDRQAALVTMKMLDNDLLRTRTLLQKQEQSGVDEKKQHKVDKLREDVQSLEAALASSRQEYEMLTSRNQEDIERLRDQQTGEYYDMVLQFTEVNAKFYSKTAEVFNRLARELGCTEDELFVLAS